MTPEDLLRIARSGDLEALGEARDEVAEAVQAFAAAGDSASAQELFARSWRIWFLRGELEEGSAVAASALEGGADKSPPWDSRTLYADGALAFRAGDRERSLARNEEALRIARETDDARGESDALTGLARIALRDGHYEQVVALAGEARARARATGDREAEAAPLHLHAAGVRLQGDYASARELYLESMRLNRELGNDAWTSMEQHNLGWVELHLGAVDEAAAHFRERDSESSIDAYGNAWSELNWSAVTLARGDRSEAKRRFATGWRALQALDVTLDPDDQSELDWLREQLQRAS